LQILNRFKQQRDESMSKRAIIKHFGCDEALFNKARLLWLKENAAECMLLGTRFENMTWESIGKYMDSAAEEMKS